MTEQQNRILVAIHGYEPTGWASQTGRVVSRWGNPLVRIFVVLDVPRPPLPFPTSVANRLYRAACAAAEDEAEARTRAATEALTATLRPAPEVVRAPLRRRAVGEVIADQAASWPADVVVVGAPPAGFRAWLWPGPVPHQVLRQASCAVLVTTPPPVASARPSLVLTTLAGAERRA